MFLIRDCGAARTGAPPTIDWSTTAVFDDLHPAFDRRLRRDAPEPIAVAFSGGGDSLALLLAAQSWAQRAGRAVLALTVDHGLQPDSPDWTRQAGATARRLGVRFQALAWTGPKPSTGLAAAARRARHALLAEAARTAGARVVLFGHTLDDELEAGLMREEGCTIGSLREWAPAPVWPEGRGVFLFRPMLGLRRAELRDRLAGTGLAWIEDPSNDDLRSARARARRALKTPSEARTAPPGDELSRLQAIAAQSEADQFGVIRLPRQALAGAAADPGRRFLALACVCAGGGEQRPRTARTERLRARIAAGEAFTACLAGARIQAGQTIEIMRDAGEMARGGLQPIIVDPGRLAVWDGRFEVAGDQTGVTIAALGGRLAQLGPEQRKALKGAPAAARPALPAAWIEGEAPTCAVLAGSGLARSGNFRARNLVAERLMFACGMFADEAKASGRL